MNPKCRLAPYGISDVLDGLLTIFFGISFEISDFIADCIGMWWDKNKDAYKHIKKL